MCGAETSKYRSHCSKAACRPSNSLVTEPKQAKTQSAVRRYITLWKGVPIPLTVDHIDGNSANNEEANLRLICNNCDALLPTYKAKNRGKGRAVRRERYAQGKSY